MIRIIGRTSIKTRIRSVCAVLALILLTPGAPARAVQPAYPEVSARSAVLINAGNGEVLFEKNKDARMGPASTTKIITAVTVLEHADISQTVVIGAASAGTEGSSLYLRAGDKTTVGDLLHGMMLASANDAASALALFVAGGERDFAELMNRRARGLGLTDTHFENPHGLDGEAHYTTAYELALLTSDALENKAFSEIVAKKHAAVSVNGEKRGISNHNRMLSYPDVTGVKTGFTKKCGRTLVCSAERDGVRLICVTLSDPDDWRDHRELLDYGFSLYERITPAKAGELEFNVPVAGTGETVTVTNRADISFAVRKGSAEPVLKTELPGFVYSVPVEGSLLGWAVYYDGEKELSRTELVVKNGILKGN